MSLSLLGKSVIAERTPSRPDGITLLVGLALLAGIMLLIAGITLGLPYTDGLANGPALIGVWIVLSFGYFGLGQFLPTMWWITMIVTLAILYLAAGIGLFSGRRWAWTLSTTLALFGVASNILQAITAPPYDFLDIPGLLVTLMILVCLISPLARNFFSKRPLPLHNNQNP